MRKLVALLPATIAVVIMLFAESIRILYTKGTIFVGFIAYFMYHGIYEIALPFHWISKYIATGSKPKWDTPEGRDSEEFFNTES